MRHNQRSHRKTEHGLLPLVMSLCSIMACTSQPSPTGPGPAGRTELAATTVAVEPGEIQLKPHQSLQFHADLRDDLGRSVANTIDWTTSGGTIDSQGNFVAGTQRGRFWVKAEGPPGRGGKRAADTAWVEIDDPVPSGSTSVSISPAYVSLEAGEARQFSTEVMVDGKPIDAQVTWSADGGAIDQAGMFTAAQEPGAYDVIATSDDGAADTATVTIVAPAAPPQPPTVSVSVAPGSVTLEAGDSQQFSADVRVDGSLVQGGQSWQATGGSIDQSGSYSAGTQAGQYRVIVAYDGHADTAVVTIEESAGSPPPPPPDDPVQGVAIYPGESIQSAVNANPSGTVFVIKPGVHRRQQVEPKRDNEFVGEPGAVLDGENATPFAFGSYGVPGADVRITGLVIRNYSSGNLQQGAIQGDNTSGWVFEGNEVRDNRGVGIRLGPGMIVRNNHAHGNWNLGIGGFRADGAIIEDNEVEGNGFNGVSGEYAGIKILESRDLVLRGNHVHHNSGRGLWLDTDIFDAVVENNTVTDNEMAGIWLEVVCRATVQNNTTLRNGLGQSISAGWPSPAGIQVVNGTDIEIVGNEVHGNLNGIAILAATGYPTHDCPLDLRNVYVHGNTITMATGKTGLAQNFGDSSYFTSRGNRFVDNTYHLGSAADYFTWNDHPMNEGEWVAAGQDTGGSFNR